MRLSQLRVAVGLAAVLVLTGCAPRAASPGTSGPAPSPAATSAVASVLLTTPKDAGDNLTGRKIGPGVLGVARNGCVTAGGAFLQVGYGSALTDGGRGVALVNIGNYRFGQRLPALYGYRNIYSVTNLPKAFARCGPGRYVSSPNALGSRTQPASTLVTFDLQRGSSTTVRGLLASAGNGCVRAGGQYVVAPRGSVLQNRGAAVRIAGSGTYKIGTWMPTLTGRFAFYTAAQLPKELSACGPGSYITVSKRQDQPVLVFDPVNDSARMVVQPASKRAAAQTRIASGVIGKRNTCITVGSVFLSAPHGSTLSGKGSKIHLTGIGTFRIGATLPAQTGRLITYPERAVPESLIDCGAGTYAEVHAR